MADYPVSSDIDTFMRSATKAAGRTNLNLDYVALDDPDDRDATAPDFIGQVARMTRGGSWYVSYGTSAGEWAWVAFGDFTPATETTWATGTSYAVGDLVKVPTQILSTGNTLDAVGSDVTATLDTAAESFADGELEGCFLEITSGTGVGQRRKILDYTSEVATVAPWIGGTTSGSRQLSGFSAPVATDGYRVAWRSGHVIYECISAHTADTYFASDLNNATPKWKVYLVEDYHYHFRGVPGATTPHEVWLLDASRADGWGGILDEVYKLMPSATSNGVNEVWGSTIGGRQGTIRFTEGNYFFDEEVKWLPRCTLTGPETPTSLSSIVVRAAARPNSLVTNGGNTYYCIKTHEAGSDDDEPGVGANTATYWTQVAAWANSTAYVAGDVISANGTFYRCHVAHTSSDGSDNDPVSPNPGTTGDTWFRWWQEENTAATAWASGTFYTEGWDILRDAYFIKGMDYGTTDTAHSAYNSGLRYLFVDANSTVRCGVRAHLSHGSKMENLEVDGFSYCGIRVAEGSDSCNLDTVIVTRQQTGSPAFCNWWFDDTLGIKVTNPVCTRAEVGMSFGVTRGFSCHGLETENCGHAFEFREHDHFEFGAVSGTGSAAGEPSGCVFTGCHFARQSTDAYTVSDGNAAFVRYALGSSSLANALVINGTSRDNSANNAPYHSIGVQLSNGDKTESYPLYPAYGENRSGVNQLSFNWSLQEMCENQRLLSLYTTEVDSRYVANGNPAALTDNGTTAVNLLPGLYEIEIAASNTWDSGDVTINESPSGNAIPGMSAYNSASKLDRWHWHRGGQMEVVVANVATASAVIRVYFQPRLNGCQVNESIDTETYPS